MAVIGRFTQTKPNHYSGALRTLALDIEVEIVPLQLGNDTSKPNFRVLSAGGCELGAGWLHRKDANREYIALQFDDPSFAAPVYANLLANRDGGFDLLWSRHKPER